MNIGLTGAAGSGKSTVAKMLFQDYGYTRIAFSDPLKSMLMELGLSHEQLYGDAKEAVDKRFGCTARHMMQTLGTEWGRELINGDIWTTAWLVAVNRVPHAVVADDVRFPNEADAVRRTRGIIIRVDRPSILAEQRSLDDHISEKLFPDITLNHVIVNDGSIADLRDKVREVVDDYTKRF